jgi:predicted transcriptional regulator
MPQKVVKMTFTLPEESYREMQEIAEKENLPLTHVLRRAIKTEQFIKEQEKHGNKILIDTGGKLERLVRV